LTGAEVINLAGLSFFGQEPVGSDNVSDVGEVADDVEVADLNPGFEPGFDLGDLPGPAWLNGRAITTSVPCARKCWTPRRSAAPLLAEYGLFGLIGQRSLTGIWSGDGFP
jgi:hypothetical protein